MQISLLRSVCINVLYVKKTEYCVENRNVTDDHYLTETKRSSTWVAETALLSKNVLFSSRVILQYFCFKSLISEKSLDFKIFPQKNYVFILTAKLGTRNQIKTVISWFHTFRTFQMTAMIFGASHISPIITCRIFSTFLLAICRTLNFWLRKVVSIIINSFFETFIWKITEPNYSY